MLTKNESNKILVAVDGSIISEKAANIALQIAQAEHSKLLGLYIVDETLILDPYADHSKELGIRRETASRATLIDWYQDLGSQALDGFRELCEEKDVSVETELLLGDVPDLILKNGDQVSAIALGRRGNGHMSSPDLLGENFIQVAHNANIPLIVGGDEERQIKRILLFSDEVKIQDQAFRETKRIQQKLHTDLVVGVQIEPQEKIKFEELHLRLKAEDLKIENILSIKSVDELPDLLDQNKIDLLIMSKYKHSEFVSWFVGSPIDQLLRITSLPVILA